MMRLNEETPYPLFPGKPSVLHEEPVWAGWPLKKSRMGDDKHQQWAERLERTTNTRPGARHSLVQTVWNTEEGSQQGTSKS